MDDEVAFPADPQPAEVVQPREGALDDPAPAAEPGAVLGLAAGDDRLHPPRPQRAPVLVVVVAAIGDDPVGTLAGSAALAAHRAKAVDEWQELGDVVAVRARQRGQQRDADRIAEQVVLGARACAIDGRRAGQAPLAAPGCGSSRRSRATSRFARPRSAAAIARGAGAPTPRPPASP
jgi:hypothetical protein